MKRTYQTPVMDIEAFAANEYVAACWDVTCEQPEAHANLVAIGHIGQADHEGAALFKANAHVANKYDASCTSSRKEEAGKFYHHVGSTGVCEVFLSECTHSPNASF